MKLSTKLTILALAVSLPAGALIDSSQEPMSRERLLTLLRSHPEVTTLDQVPAVLPDDFLMNFVLKHGVKRKGERGHLVETVVSQSSSPQAPRAIVYDERSGFTVSYNGGAAGQTAPHRLDVMSFDATRKTFSLEQIDFPIQAGQPKLTTSDCKSCHGPNERPIFAMYPDWPAFYGSDNDELTGATATQEAEFGDYKKFRETVAKNHPRYRPLFDVNRVKKYLNTDVYASYPYRPDNSERARDVSRAFAFRPELRMGILYNRLTAQNIEKRIMSHKRFNEFAPYFLFNLLECSWSPAKAAAQAKWSQKVQSVLGKKTKTIAGGQLDYRQNLALFDLRVTDIDIRYSYDHAGYANEDASKSVMEVGYIGRYFNSYFDGSATIDELISASLVSTLSEANPSLKGSVKMWGLMDKYGHFEDRLKYDEKFFRQMDAMGKWIHIPYPASLSKVHHRESFTSDFAAQHKVVCNKLEGLL